MQLRNQDHLQNLLQRLYDPSDPLYGHYLKPEEFAAQFGPTEADVASVAEYATQRGLRVTDISPNGTLVHVAGSHAAISNALGTRLVRWMSPKGSTFMASENEPLLPADLASKIVTITGLEDAVKAQPQSSRITAEGPRANFASPNLFSSGHGALSPNDIRSIYGLKGSPLNGSGQTLAIVALDTYNPADVTHYKSEYGGAAVAIQNIGVNGFNTATPPGIDAGETVLDIDMCLALAPAASKILVYENVNSTQGLLDIYNKIATDNIAKQISTSWSSSEEQNSGGGRQAEFNAFAQMAAQGQSFYAAAGDNAAWENQDSLGSAATLSVADPASQPFVTGVGGTNLQDSSSMGYVSETAWFTPSNKSRGPFGTGGGGGVSKFWNIAPWQVKSINTTVNPQGSTTMRNVPDVSLFADFDVAGYSVWYTDPSHGANWYIFNGTSAAAPLWASYTALVNQARASAGRPPLGYANPALYAIAQNSTQYANDFHDVKSGSNGFFNSVAGYDNATGLGSFNGINLLNDLQAFSPPAVNLSTFAASPNPVVTGGSFTLTVTLNIPAPPGGIVVPVTNNGAPWTTITVPGGSTSGSVAMKAGPPGTIALRATLGGASIPTNVVVTPPALATFTATPNPALLANPITLKATLNAPAPAGGMVVTITFNGAAWTSITVPANTLTASTSAKAPAAGNATLTATGGGVSISTSISVTASSLTAFTASPNPAVFSSPITLKATISPAAPAGGVVIPVTYNGAAWASITVPAGATAGSATAMATTTGAVTLQASLGGVTRAASITVDPVGIKTLTATPNPVVVTNPVTLTVTLNGPATPGGTAVWVTFNGTGWTTITVPAGATSATGTAKPLATGVATVTAFAGFPTGVSTTITVNPVAAASVAATPSPAVLTNPMAVTVTTNAPAPSGGVAVPVTFNGATWTTVTVPAGATSATGSAVPLAAGTATLQATAGGVSKSTTVTVNQVALATFTAASSTVRVNTPLALTATLNGLAPAGGVLIPVTKNGVLWVNIAIAAGRNNAGVNVTPTTTGTLVLGASAGGVTQTQTVTVTP